jgi:hypothetical protein
MLIITGTKETHEETDDNILVDFCFSPIEYNPAWKQKSLIFFFFLNIIFYSENMYLQIHSVHNCICAFLMYVYA